MQTKVGYIKLGFGKESVEFYSTLLAKLTKPEDLYFSPVVPHISGSKVDELHLTLYFGLSPQNLTTPKFKRTLAGYKFDTFKVSGVELFSGYQSLYQILCLRIDDTEGILKDFYRAMNRFAVEPDTTLSRFKPHVTLAYVNSEYSLPKIKLELPSLAVETIETKIYVRDF